MLLFMPSQETSTTLLDPGTITTKRILMEEPEKLINLYLYHDFSGGYMIVYICHNLPNSALKLEETL